MNPSSTFGGSLERVQVTVGNLITNSHDLQPHARGGKRASDKGFPAAHCPGEHEPPDGARRKYPDIYRIYLWENLKQPDHGLIGVPQDLLAEQLGLASPRLVEIPWMDVTGSPFHLQLAGEFCEDQDIVRDKAPWFERERLQHHTSEATLGKPRPQVPEASDPSDPSAEGWRNRPKVPADPIKGWVPHRPRHARALRRPQSLHAVLREVLANLGLPARRGCPGTC